VIDPTFWVGLGTGLAASAVGGLLLWWFLGRESSDTDSTLDVQADILPIPPEGAGSGLDAILPGEPNSTAAEEHSQRGPGGYSRPGITIPTSWEDGLRSSERLLLYIARQGVVGPDEVAPRALCQAGMIEALGMSQGALTGVLRRLVSARVLEESREHVRGIDRRVKVYRLTPAGDRLVRHLRGRRPSGPPERGAAGRTGTEARLPRVEIFPPPSPAPTQRT
jgi:DNA-binding MarR family transcriptional regulator